MTIDLSPDQRQAYNSILDWVAGQSGTLTLGGYAGTGKTTLLSVFALGSELTPVCFVAYTGKAASVLGRKLRAAGVGLVDRLYSPYKRGGDADFPMRRPYCGTIHSLIYKPCECKETVQPGDPPRARPCPICKEARGNFVLRQSLDRDYQLIIVDEASMVSDDMLADLRSFGIPILAVGDHGQLPPVKGVGSLMKDPEIRLEKIHRQAEGNPIIMLSKAIRETGDFDTRLADGKRVRFGSMRALGDEVKRRFAGKTDLFDQMLISYTNPRRVGLNEMARAARGFKGKPPQEGEQVICLRNMRALGVFNGMRGLLETTARQSEESPWLHSARISWPEDDAPTREFDMCEWQFNRDKTFNDLSEVQKETGVQVYSWDGLGSLFDFGYALTAHKAQGSGVADVLVCADEVYGDADNKRRWRYTATTRASETLTVLR